MEWRSTTLAFYGVGAAESAWGEILKDFKRDSYVLATKVFFPMSRTDRGLSAEQIRKQCDAMVVRPVAVPAAAGPVALPAGVALAVLGETIVVYLIISPVFTINWHLLQPGGNSICIP